MKIVAVVTQKYTPKKGNGWAGSQKLISYEGTGVFFYLMRLFPKKG